MQPGAHRKKFAASFIANAQRLFPDKFSYDLVNYVDSSTKVTIVCKEHGPFQKTPNNLLHSRCGCTGCRRKNELTKYIPQDTFLEQARLKHQDTYDYSKVDYKDLKTPVTIICSVHGEFEQRPNLHMNGAGCKRCRLAVGTLRYSTETFRHAVQQVHGDKYDLTDTEYVRGHVSVDVRCPTHGVFTIEASGLLAGGGCVTCSTQSRQQMYAEQFLQRSQIIHGNKYDYSYVNYTDGNSKVCIVCDKHGKFWQLARCHLDGHGCARCSIRHSKNAIQWLDFMAWKLNIQIQHAENGGEYQINRFFVDGFCKETNTVFEYQGTYWHGSPRLYDRDAINPHLNKTFGYLYDKTIAREAALKKLGYKVINMWDVDWVPVIQSVIRLQRAWRKKRMMRQRRLKRNSDGMLVLGNQFGL